MASTRPRSTRKSGGGTFGPKPRKKAGGAIPMPKVPRGGKLRTRPPAGPATRKWLALSDLEKEKMGPKARGLLGRAMLLEYKRANKIKA